jgi:hypothetical protein
LEDLIGKTYTKEPSLNLRIPRPKVSCRLDAFFSFSYCLGNDLKEALMPTNLVIDADGHCYEPDAGLVKWLPKEYAHLAPNRVTDSSGYSHLMIEGRLAGRRRWGGGADRGAVFADHVERSRPGMTDATKRLPDMDEEGIDVAVIFGLAANLRARAFIKADLNMNSRGVAFRVGP